MSGTITQKTVTAASTDLTPSGFVAGKQSLSDVPADTTELGIQGGALMAGGNSRSAAFTGGIRYLLRRAESEVGAGAAVNYAQSAPDQNSSMEPTVENYQGTVRYDYFLTESVAVFLATSGRRDRFQGLDFRLSIDPGVALYVLRRQDVRFWTEIGYDFQHDIRSEDAIEQAEAEGQTVAVSERRHNGRLFVGYEHRLDERLSFDTGLELIRSFVTPENYRINYAATVNTVIREKLSLAVGTTTMFDNNPLPGVRKLDVTSSLSLVYTLL